MPVMEHNWTYMNAAAFVCLVILWFSWPVGSHLSSQECFFSIKLMLNWNASRILNTNYILIVTKQKWWVHLVPTDRFLGFVISQRKIQLWGFALRLSLTLTSNYWKYFTSHSILYCKSLIMINLSHSNQLNLDDSQGYLGFKVSWYW